MKIQYVLHFYQPDFQFKQVLEDVYTRSYKPIFEIIKNTEGAKLNINITASTIEQFNKYQVGNIQQDIKELYELRKVKLLATSLSHTLLSHSSLEQALRQIKINNGKLSYYLGIPEEEFNILYPPELSVNNQVIKLVKSIGLKGIIIPNSALQDIDEVDNKFMVKGVKTLVRSLKVSRMLESPSITDYQNLKEIFKEKDVQDSNYIAVHDAEVIGYSVPDKINLFRDLYKDRSNEFGFLSEEISKNNFKKYKKNIIPATWEKMMIHGELIDPHWMNENNNIHRYQWKLTNLIVDFIEDIRDDDLKFELQNHLDYSQYSCQYWWASSYPFWSPGIISHASWNWLYLGYRAYFKMLPVNPVKSKKFINAVERAYLGINRSLADYDITKWHEANIKYYDEFILPLKLQFQI